MVCDSVSQFLGFFFLSLYDVMIQLVRRNQGLESILSVQSFALCWRIIIGVFLILKEFSGCIRESGLLLVIVFP